MSASDSEYSIDWLASDEEYDSPVGLSTDHPDRQKTSLPQSLSRESPTTIHAGLIGSTTNCDENSEEKIRNGNSRVKNDRNGNDSSSVTPTTAKDTAKDSWVTETQRYIFFGQQQRQSWALWTTSPYTIESAFGGKHRQPRKRSHSPGLPVQREGTKPEEADEDKLLARKCLDLQCYIRPLSNILLGLQSGRYSGRLSSFQESVAMDRIQRIMGVLQNPNMGERYIRIILKMEEMLHSWFPHVKACCDHLIGNQKDDSTPAKRQKYHSPAKLPPLAPLSSLCPTEGDHTPRAGDAPFPGSYFAPHLKWLHTSPICSSKTTQQTPARPSTCPPSSRQDPGMTQDNAVSSSTDPKTEPHLIRPRRQPIFKISSPCLERLLKAKGSIITPRNMGDGSNESSGS
ncbi:uncharacterized protein LOC134028090 [Osmerus eperlanus]|uniref:uncharacterized protein LOC134028090 n=1 Tax=Osmerus eperlanus TaxID=29151 RepID=UPI002E104B9D